MIGNKNQLSLEQQILIEQRIANEGKSSLIAYFLWFILGAFGVHRFYLGKYKSAFFMLLISIICVLPLGCAFLFDLDSFFSFAGYIAFIGLSIITVWWLIDALLIPKIITNNHNKLRKILSKKIK